MKLGSPSELFIRRPVATTLLTFGIALAGLVAFALLPVSPLPQVDFPTISVSAGLPGASPETMASSVATPLERQFGRIAGVTEMTSRSSTGSTNISLQFDLSRNVNAAAREVQAAISEHGHVPVAVHALPPCWSCGCWPRVGWPRPAPSACAAGWHRGSGASRKRRMGAGGRDYRIPGSTSSAASANESS